MATVKDISFTWHGEKIAQMSKYMQQGLFMLGYDIANQARINAPVVTSALRNSIRVEEAPNEATIYVKAGGIVASGRAGGALISRRVDYADKRERGPNRNPATEHYMQNAQEFIMTDGFMKKYFGGITK